jgi:hypothetical protein
LKTLKLILGKAACSQQQQQQQQQHQQQHQQQMMMVDASGLTYAHTKFNMHLAA